MTRHNFEVNVIVDIDEEEIKRKAIDAVVEKAKDEETNNAE